MYISYLSYLICIISYIICIIPHLNGTQLFHVCSLLFTDKRGIAYITLHLTRSILDICSDSWNTSNMESINKHLQTTDSCYSRVTVYQYWCWDFLFTKIHKYCLWFVNLSINLSLIINVCCHWLWASFPQYNRLFKNSSGPTHCHFFVCFHGIYHSNSVSS